MLSSSIGDHLEAPCVRMCSFIDVLAAEIHRMTVLPASRSRAFDSMLAAAVACMLCALRCKNCIFGGTTDVYHCDHDGKEGRGIEKEKRLRIYFAKGS